MPYTSNGGALDLGEALMMCGDREKGEEIIVKSCINDLEYIAYYLTLGDSRFYSMSREINLCIYWARDAYFILKHMKSDKADAIEAELSALLSQLEDRNFNFRF